MKNTAAVISYCSYQKDFIEELIKQARMFVSGEIVVVSFDKYFDGMKEEPLKSFGEIDLRLKFVPGYESRYYHNLQRKAGYDVLQGDYDAVYFFDGDEVPMGKQMKAWQDNAEVGDYRFASNWYYKDTCFVAKELIDSLALVSVETLESSECNWFGPSERENFSLHHKWRRLTSDWEGKAMVDHYGWAGTKQMLLRKVKSWGHNEDRDWVGLVEALFSHEFDYTCEFKPWDRFVKVKSKLGFTYNEE